MKISSAIVVSIGIFFIFLGTYALVNPPGFYALFNPPDFAPPFEKGDIQERGMYIYIPGIIQLIAGIGFILSKVDEILEMGALRTQRTPYVPPATGGEALEEPELNFDENVEIPVEDEFLEVGTKHELEGMEVYTLLGAYWGKVESVILDKDGGVDELVAVKGTERRIVKREDIDSYDQIILVREGSA